MELTVSKEALAWFEENIGIPKGALPQVRFKSKIYGSSPLHETLALIFEINEPLNPIATYRGDNDWLFYIEEEDEWFFEGHDLKVSFDEKEDEPIFIYIKDGEEKY